jgi:hypothetical protein
MKHGLRSLAAAIVIVAGCFSFAPIVAPNSVQPVSALACNPGWTQTSYTRQFGFWTKPNASGVYEWTYYTMTFTGCYNGTYSEGLSKSVTHGAGESVPSQYFAFYPDGTTGRTILRNGRWYWDGFYFDSTINMRIRLSNTGTWYIGLTTISCNFGLAGGSCGYS